MNHGNNGSNADEYITLKVVGLDGSRAEFPFKKHAPFRKFMNVWCNRMGCSMRTVNFTFDRQVINEDDTLTSMKMEDGDTITVSCRFGNSEFINLNVVGRAWLVGNFQFKIHKHTPLRKLMNAYCDRAGLPMEAVHFRFNGQVINKGDTPSSLQLKEDSTIVVYQPSCEDAIISVKVLGPDDGVMNFEINKHTSLRGLMKDYCDRAGLSMQMVRFRFDGHVINEHDTPISVKIKNGDVIDVYRPSGESEHINLKVRESDNTVTHFKLKKHSPLRKLMNTYCDKVPTRSQMCMMRFRFDGQEIDENDTPASLKMEEGDTIELQSLKYNIVRSSISIDD